MHMRRPDVWKKLFAAVMAASVFVTDQSVIYAAEAAEMFGEEPDQIVVQQPTALNAELYQEDSWYPVYAKDACEEEDFLFEQEWIAETEEAQEPEYKEAYGDQLSGLAGELYESLTGLWEDPEDIREIRLGEFRTEEADLDGSEYEGFCSRYEQAAQNAWDAFWYDVTDSEDLDTENDRLAIRYTGSRMEDGSCQWQAQAVWRITHEETEEEEASEQAGIEDSFAYLRDGFQTIREAWEQEQELREQEEFTDESYARSFKRVCEQAGIECVLVKGMIGEAAGVWNLVRMEDESWYLTDIPRGILLEGSKALTEEEAAEERRSCGDFSNTHMGIFAYPQWSETDYVPSEDASVTEGEVQEDVSASDSEQGAAVPSAGETSPEDASASEQGGAVPSAGEISPEDASVPPAEETITEVWTASEQNASAAQVQPAGEAYAGVPETSEQDSSAAQIPQAEEAASASGISRMAAVGEEESRAVPKVEEKVLTQVSVSSVKAQTYTGGAITPKVKVKDTATGKTLKPGKQYTVSYENNVNAGQAEIVIRGIEGAGYDGVLRVYFTINPMNISKVSAKVVGKEFPFTGKPVTPGVNAQYKKAALQEGSDYQVTYVNNINQGSSAQLQLTGTGNYTGTKTLKFKITSKKMKYASVVLSSYSGTYAGQSALPAVTVTYDGELCQENVDYTVKYPKTLKIGKNAIVISGTGNYTGSVKATYVVSKGSMADAQVHFPYAWQYTGKKLKPLPTSVTVGGAALQAGKDYTVKYQPVGGKKGSVKEAGNYQIILTGKKNYQGTLIFDFCVTGDPNVLAQNYNSAASTIKDEDTPPAEEVLPDTSPDETVEVDHDRYFGYYEGYKIFSKKGIQGASDYTEELRAQHVLLNVDMADLISTNAGEGYIPYVYKGKTYYFSDLIALKDTVYYLHGWGGAENPYGANHMRNVTFVLLMSWKDELSYLIHPSARRRGAAPYYALNMQEAQARDTFEALFRYMGEEFGAYKTRVSNWTLGNEVNSCKEWNYSGSMSLNDCVANYAQAFQLLYQGVKRAATSSRVFISLDHCWTASVAGHSGKAYLDQFAAYMDQTARDMQWNVNYHPYSQPLSRTAFWKDASNTTASSGTKYISMKNIQVLTDYLSGIESMYGKAGNSIRVIIGELGYTARQGRGSEETEQAAALGYGYYIAMFNTRIDAYIIRAYLDDPAETSTGLYLGLRDKGHAKKEAYDVYTYLDTDQSLSYMNQYLSVTGVGSWESAIPGFDAGALTAADF